MVWTLRSATAPINDDNTYDESSFPNPVIHPGKSSNVLSTSPGLSSLNDLGDVGSDDTMFGAALNAHSDVSCRSD
jgi:hypothetical protein